MAKSDVVSQHRRMRCWSDGWLRCADYRKCCDALTPGSYSASIDVAHVVIASRRSRASGQDMLNR